MKAPFTVEVLYCDDIREELGGKRSYMGVYDAEMGLASFPYSFPKFCIHVKIKLNIESPPKNVKVFVKSGDAIISQTVLDEMVLGAQPVPQRPDDVAPEDFFLGMMFSFVHTPFVVESPTIIRVWVEVDGDTRKGSALRITTQKPQSAGELTHHEPNVAMATTHEPIPGGSATGSESKGPRPARKR